jgi:hypothetical protein
VCQQIVSEVKYLKMAQGSHIRREGGKTQLGEVERAQVVVLIIAAALLCVCMSPVGELPNEAFKDGPI